MMVHLAWAAVLFILAGVILFNAYGYGQRSAPVGDAAYARALGWLEVAIFAWMLAVGVFVTLGIGVWNVVVLATGLGGRTTR